MSEKWREDLISSGIQIEKESEKYSIAHRVTAERWNNIQVVLGLFMAIFSAIAGASMILNLPNFQFWAGLIALSVTISSVINSYLKPGEWKANHENAHKMYSSLSIDIQRYYNVECKRRFVEGVPTAQTELGQIFRDLTNRMSILKKDSPMLPSWALKFAETEMKN